VLYVRATVKFRGAGRTRRWQLAIAIVAALGLFAAVTTGWASRGLAPGDVRLPQPAAFSLGDHPQPTSHLDHGSSSDCDFSSDFAPPHQKPTKNAWMTRDRPQTWARLSPQSVWWPLPASFATSRWRGGANTDPPTGAPTDQDILTQLCVDRS
jgi:hypothetical protein